MNRGKMEDTYINKILIAALVIALAILSFFLLQPILMSIILGFILVFIFAPIYNWILKLVKSKNLAAFIITLILIAIIVIPIVLFLPIMINESIKIFTGAQQLDLVTPLKNLFPSLFSSDVFTAQVGSILHNIVTTLTTGAVNLLSNFLINLPVISLQFTVVLFTFFFVIRDKSEFIEYLKGVLPFSKEIQEKLLKATKDVTTSVLYGHVIIGILQGLVAGIGFFLFGVPSPLLFTILAIFAGILPVLGPALIWIPVAIYLLISGNNVSAIGVTIFGLASIAVDSFFRPMIVSKRLTMNSLLVLLGMIGGFFIFGALGFILGPLIIAYLLIFLEVYRNRKFTGLLVRS